MNDDQTKELLKELRLLRLCAVTIAVVVVLAFLSDILNIRF